MHLKIIPQQDRNADKKGEVIDMTTDEEKAKTLFNALFNQELARTGSIKAAKDGAAILFYKDIIEHEVAEARASAVIEWLESEGTKTLFYEVHDENEQRTWKQTLKIIVAKLKNTREKEK